MHTKRVTLFLPAIVLAGCYLHGAVIAAPTPMILAEGGGTDSVLTGHPDAPDIELGLGELAEHLKAATGADFRTVAVAAGLPSIPTP